MRNITDIHESLEACRTQIDEVIAYLLCSISEWEDEYVGEDGYIKSIKEAKTSSINLYNEIGEAINCLDDLTDHPF